MSSSPDRQGCSSSPAPYKAKSVNEGLIRLPSERKLVRRSPVALAQFALSSFAAILLPFRFATLPQCRQIIQPSQSQFSLQVLRSFSYSHPSVRRPFPISSPSRHTSGTLISGRRIALAVRTIFRVPLLLRHSVHRWVDLCAARVVRRTLLVWQMFSPPWQQRRQTPLLLWWVSFAHWTPGMTLNWSRVFVWQRRRGSLERQKERGSKEEERLHVYC